MLIINIINLRAYMYQNRIDYTVIFVFNIRLFFIMKYKTNGSNYSSNVICLCILVLYILSVLKVISLYFRHIPYNKLIFLSNSVRSWPLNHQWTVNQSHTDAIRNLPKFKFNNIFGVILMFNFTKKWIFVRNATVLS